jgi:hypothetical protein
MYWRRIQVSYGAKGPADAHGHPFCGEISEPGRAAYRLRQFS